MKHLIVLTTCLTVLLYFNIVSVHATEDRFEFNASLGLLHVYSFDLPISLLKTPVHPNDTSWAGDTQIVDIESGTIPSFDLGLAVKPLPWKFFNNLRFGYTLKIFYYSDGGYKGGITGRKLYTNPTWEAYTYTKISDFDTFAHELHFDYGWTFKNKSKLALGCKYLFWGMEVEQGWDRYAKETPWRNTKGDVRGFMPFISYEFFANDDSFRIDLDYANLDVDFDNIGNGDMKGVNIKVGYTWRF